MLPPLLLLSLCVGLSSTVKTIVRVAPITPPSRPQASHSASLAEIENRNNRTQITTQAVLLALTTVVLLIFILNLIARWVSSSLVVSRARQQLASHKTNEESSSLKTSEFQIAMYHPRFVNFLIRIALVTEILQWSLWACSPFDYLFYSYSRMKIALVLSALLPVGFFI